MNAEQIQAIISKVEAAPIKIVALREIAVPKQTYYLWLKKFRAGGKDALQTLVSLWTENEDKRLVELATGEYSLQEISSQLDSRTRKAVEARLKYLGISLLGMRRETARRIGKICSVCRARKPLAEFYDAHYESVDGKMSLCKVCFTAKTNSYKKANKTLVLRQAREYRQRVKREDPERLIRYRSGYRQTSRGSFMALRAHCRINSKRKALFQLEWEEFRLWYANQPQICRYCGINLQDYLEVRLLLPGVAAKTKALTIDRLNSSRPYELGNIAFACCLCNYLKGYAFSADEFQEIAARYVRPFFQRLLA